MRRRAYFAALSLTGLLLLDATGREMLAGGIKFDFLEATQSNSKVLFVYFPGVLSDGVMSSQELTSVWCQHGDVLLVSYTGDRFDGEIIARNSSDEIQHRVEQNGYEHVVFLGASMGGLVAYDAFGKLDGKKLWGVKVSFVLMDAPTKRSDLQSPLDTISLGSQLWLAGPISNLVSKPYFDATFVEPKEENIEPGVDRQKLAKVVERSKSYPLSWSMDQNRYIIDHDPVERGTLAGINIVYVRSKRDDDTVRPRAFDSWNQAAAFAATWVEVDSTHVGFNERPGTWRTAFRKQIIPALRLN